MDLSPQSSHKARLIAQKSRIRAGLSSLLSFLFFTIGCASPGPPRSPSLSIPEPVTDLTARRVGDSVHLQFTVPSRSTDKLALHGPTVTGRLCRQLAQAACITPAGFAPRIALAILDLAGRRNSVVWTDSLPSDLTSGAPQILAYRVEFFSASGGSAGLSEAAYTATGPSPKPVTGLQAEGSRLGVVLHWDSQEKSGETLVERETLPNSLREVATTATPSNRNPNPHIKSSPHQHLKSPHSTSKSTSADTDAVWLTAASPGTSSSLLDTGVQLDTRYLYRASRRIFVHLGGRTIELRGEVSAPVAFTLHPTYPPPTPTGLTAAGFMPNLGKNMQDASQSFAVDLIWQPVEASGLLVPLAGYNVFRQLVGTEGQKIGDVQLQTPTPLPLPAFHDAKVVPTQGYLYSVTAVDVRGNQSEPITIVVEPSNAP